MATKRENHFRFQYTLPPLSPTLRRKHTHMRHIRPTPTATKKIPIAGVPPPKSLAPHSRLCSNKWSSCHIHISYCVQNFCLFCFVPPVDFRSQLAPVQPLFSLTVSFTSTSGVGRPASRHANLLDRSSTHSRNKDIERKQSIFFQLRRTESILLCSCISGTQSLHRILLTPSYFTFINNILRVATYCGDSN